MGLAFAKFWSRLGLGKVCILSCNNIILYYNTTICIKQHVESNYVTINNNNNYTASIFKLFIICIAYIYFSKQLMHNNVTFVTQTTCNVQYT